jgi:hypothetical protein
LNVEGFCRNEGKQNNEHEKCRLNPSLHRPPILSTSVCLGNEDNLLGARLFQIELLRIVAKMLH